VFASGNGGLSCTTGARGDCCPGGGSGATMKVSMLNLRRWPMTGLLDILKETDLRIRFTDAFSTAAAREATDREEVRRRLLLCLYGLGTNAGLTRLAVGDHGFSHKELLHTRRRYVDAESLRDATRRVVNATLAVRDPALWGEARPRARPTPPTSARST
jgi:Tn3 transposase DDE domain-containing protein